MARKKPNASHLREVINNAAPAKLSPTNNDGDDDGGSPRRPLPPALPPDCPVIPIGMGEGTRYYLNAARQLVTLKVRDHTRLEIMGMFGEHADLVHEIWPRKKKITDKNGVEREIVTGWRPEEAGEQLMRLSAAKGIWSPIEKARGRGCWRDESGGLVVNIGSAVFSDGQWRRPGLYGDHVMIAREAILKPALLSEPGGTRGAGAEILALLSTWQWRRPIDARLLLGWIVCALLGAALPIRPVGWIIGPRATGKSTLQTAVTELMGGWLMAVLDPTPASIWQTLRHDCLPVAIDEAEPDEDRDNRRRLNELVKLARLGFSGGKLPRGGSDGEATEYSLRSAVLFSSINRPPLLPQDRSRMVLMRLGKLPIDQHLPDVSRERLRPLGARLLRRAIDGWPRLGAAFEQLRLALKAEGHEGRSSEVFGMALAASEVVLSDYAMDSDTAAELAAQLPYSTLVEAEDDLPDEESWLSRLLSCRIPLDGTGPRNTVAAWLRQAVKSTNLYDRQEADRILAQYGLKAIRPKAGGEPVQFAVANHGAGLEQLHDGTHWAGRSGAIGGWKAAARELPDAEETTQRFGDWRGKGTVIPLKLAFPDGYAEGMATRSVDEELGIDP
jgi:hypothetical protein